MENTTVNGNDSSSFIRSTCGSCLRLIRRKIPVGAKTEVFELAKLAGPACLAQLMVFSVSFISTVFCGHLGKTELAGVSLAITVINVTGMSIGAGLASGCDTLISQTYGSGNLLKVGVILQRAILILMLACCPCWAVLINTESILLAVKQNPEVARLCQMYVKIYMPALPATFLYYLEARYLQNQGIIWPQVITGVVVNLLNALFNYVLVYALNLGVAGSAVANTISQFSLAIMLHTYIIWKGLHKASWGGWSKECLHEWGAFIRLAIPCMIMMCVEWWTYEIGGFLAGLISEVELGAQSVVNGLSNVAYMLPLGFGVAGSVRVGNALGAGETEQAKLSSKMTMLCAGSVSMCLSVVIGSLKDYISYVFTYDEQIRERVTEIMSFYAPFLLLDALSAASTGVIRGAGMQKVGAIVSLVGYYVVGFPIGVSLMFGTKLGIKGLWTGLVICVSVQSSYLSYYLTRLNWKKVTAEALMRAGVHGSSTEKEGLLEDMGPCKEHTDTEELDDVGNRSVVESLSYRALVLRRGLALAGMLSILAAGIIINLVNT